MRDTNLTAGSPLTDSLFVHDFQLLDLFWPDPTVLTSAAGSDFMKLRSNTKSFPPWSPSLEAQPEERGSYPNPRIFTSPFSFARLHDYRGLLTPLDDVAFRFPWPLNPLSLCSGSEARASFIDRNEDFHFAPDPHIGEQRPRGHWR